MTYRHAFALVDLLLLIGCVAIGTSLLLCVNSTNGRTSRQMGNSTQVRGIHSGLVMYAQGNNTHYVGIEADGVTVDPTAGLTTQGRVQRLIDDNYFTLEYARSMSEKQTGVTSYAMLQVNRSADEKTVLKGGRNHEWKDTTNTNSVVISDRAIDNGGNYSYIKSVHTNPWANVNEWHGSVGWNDNHVTFEQLPRVPTDYSGLPFDRRHEVNLKTDDLFARSSNAKIGDDAFMVWHGTDKL